MIFMNKVVYKKRPKKPNLHIDFQSYLDTEGKRSGLSGDNSGLAPEEAEMAAAAAVKPDTNPYEFKGS